MQNPYNLTGENGDFVFETDLDLQYKIIFQKHNVFDELGYSTFEFSFYPVGKHELRYDPRIKDTIISALKDFFLKNPDSIILYVCDSSDNRARERNMLFNRWFKEQTSIEIVRLNRKIFDTESDKIYYFSIAFNQTFISPTIVESFIEIEESAYNK